MIIGLGLPRTGTRSLYKALTILGYKGAHHCELAGSKEFDGGDFLIDTDYNSELRPGTRYILTVRDTLEWRESIGRFGYKGQDIVAHASRIMFEAKRNGIEYLLYDIRYGWKPLCEFLNKPVPDIDFPNIK